MEIEELKVKISASCEGFEENISKIKAQLNSLDGVADKISQKLNGKLNGIFSQQIKTDALKKGFDDITSKVSNKTGEMVSKIGKKTTQAAQNLKSMMSKLSNTMVKGVGNFKIPNVSTEGNTIPKAVDANTNVSKRGPPVDIESLKDIKLGKIQSLDITDRQIENLRTKLDILKDKLSKTFNVERKNKLESTILSTESRMDSLINKSIKLSGEIKGLNSKIGKVGNTSNIPNVSNANEKLGSSYKNASKGVNNLANNTKKANSSLNSHSNMISMITRRLIVWRIMIPMILKGLKAVATALGQGLMTNQQFANSFNQIKTNMMVAFTPILQAILPALNILMSALAKATTYIASFISAIFGKTYMQSYKATQQLIDAKVAMGAYGDSAKKAAKDVKGLAAIDEINTLSAANANIAGNDKIPQLVAPPIDTAAVDSSMKALVDRIKKSIAGIDFKPLKNSFVELKAAISPVVDNVGKILIWFIDNALKPLAKWTIEDVLPAFFRVLAGAFKVLNPLLEVFMDLGDWLWRNFLQPIASWTGGIIVDVLNGLADALGKIGNWMANNKPIVKGITVAVLGFFAAWKTTELLGFIGESGGVIGALKRISKALFGVTAAKIADKFETMALTAMYAKDFVMSIGSSIKSLALQAGQFAKNIAIKIADKAETIALAALYAKDFVVSVAKGTLELIKQGGQFAISTGLKIADKIATLAMTAATVGWNVVCGIATVATTALGAAFAFLTSPIGLVILAIGAVIAIGVLLYKHWDVIKAKAIEVWDGVKEKFNEFKEWLGNVFATDWSQKFGFFGEILNGFLANTKNMFDSVKRIFGGIIDFIAGAFTADWSRCWKGVQDIFGGIFDGLASLIKKPMNTVISLINGAIGGINKISIDIPDWIPSWAGGGSHFGPNIGKIPYLAKGGIIDSPTMAMVGEAGKEAVMPLENNTGWITQLAETVASRMPQGNSDNGFGDGDLNLYIDGDVIGKVALKKLRKMQRQGGLTLIPT